LPGRRRGGGHGRQGDPGRLAGARRQQGRARALPRGDRVQHVHRRSLRRAVAPLPPGAQSAGMRYRGSLAVWIALIAYASLYPFLPLRPPPDDALAVFFSKPRYTLEFDVALNVIAYIPLGLLARLHFASAPRRAPPFALAVALGAALSFAVEVAQLFIPYRVASIQDVAANTAGAALGAALFVDPVRSLLTAPI